MLERYVVPVSLWRRPSKSGLSIAEWVVVSFLVVLLTTFAVVSLGNGGESTDARTVQSVQESLQSIVSQGALRMDTRPDQLTPSAVLMAVQSAVGQSKDNASGNVRFNNVGNQYIMTIDRSQRSATFIVASNGDVRLVGLNNFPNYRVDSNSGSISRTP